MKIKISPSPLLIVTVWGMIHKCYFSKFSSSILSLKSCFFLLVIFPFFISDSNAQNFFPLKVGNTYQVEDDWWWVQGNTGGSGTNYYIVAVVKDTIILGDTFYNINYNNFSQPFCNDCYFRFDSLQQKLFIKIPGDTTIRLAVDFALTAGSNYTSYISGTADNYTSLGISPVVFLGDTHLVYTMEDAVIPRHTYQFSDDIGFKQYKYYFATSSGASSSTENVVSAIIDSVIYNPLVLRVDSLYPVFDRPIDTFPYLMTIPYTASYSALVDSFYLSVIHIRSDTLVQNERFYISKSNSHITFYLNNLVVGDKIKLRAAITDTSIYNNTDVFPDTGWVVMNVLPPILNVENEYNPLNFELTQNYPNPFNPITTIRYQIPEQTFVAITVFDILGNIIEKLVYEEKNAGSYDIEFDGTKLSSGIYYYQISTEKFHQTRKMILIK